MTRDSLTARGYFCNVAGVLAQNKSSTRIGSFVRVPHNTADAKWSSESFRPASALSSPANTSVLPGEIKRVCICDLVR